MRGRAQPFLRSKAAFRFSAFGCSAPRVRSSAAPRLVRARASPRSFVRRSSFVRRCSLRAGFARPPAYGGPLRASSLSSSLLSPSLWLACSSLPWRSALALFLRFAPSLRSAPSRLSAPKWLRTAPAKSPPALTRSNRQPPRPRKPFRAQHRPFSAPPLTARQRLSAPDVCAPNGFPRCCQLRPERLSAGDVCAPERFSALFATQRTARFPTQPTTQPTTQRFPDSQRDCSQSATQPTTQVTTQFAAQIAAHFYRNNNNNKIFFAGGGNAYAHTHTHARISTPIRAPSRLRRSAPTCSYLSPWTN